jgi:5-methyltetrahydrofolate--homocysteine methyltransferase
VLDNDQEVITKMAREQIAHGSSFLDLHISLDETGREIEAVKTVVALLAQKVDVPLFIDSLKVDVITAGVQQLPERTIINSISLSEEKKTHQLFTLAKEAQCPLVCSLIDEKGIAKTLGHKIEIAERMFQLATEEYKISPKKIILDAIALPLHNQGFQSEAKATLQMINHIKNDYPKCRSLIGLSNISFGWPTFQREGMNRSYYTRAQQAGVDLVIAHPAHLQGL